MTGVRAGGSPQAAASRRGLLAAVALCILAGPSQADIGSLVDRLEGTGLVDARGQRFEPRGLLGHLTLVQFFHTGCKQICSDQTRDLVELRRQLPPDLRRRVRFLAISLDPHRDSPSAIQAYARRHGAEQSGWHWVTGRPEAIDRLASALLLFPPKPQPGEPAALARLSAFRQAQLPTPAGSPAAARPQALEAHDKALWLLDSRGAMRQRYGSHPVDIRRLSVDLHGLAELDRLQRNTG